jgi:hypothetical protein
VTGHTPWSKIRHKADERRAEELVKTYMTTFGMTERQAQRQIAADRGDVPRDRIDLDESTTTD